MPAFEEMQQFLVYGYVWHCELVDELERIAPTQNEEETEEKDDIIYEDVEKCDKSIKGKQKPRNRWDNK